MAEIDQHTLKVQQLFMRYQGQLKSFVLALVPDFAQADDILQEVFLTVTDKANDFQLDTNFLAWSRSITRYKILESNRQTPGFNLSSELIDSLSASCPESQGADDKVEALSTCLRNLAPNAQKLIQLRYKREHSPSEIAKILDRSINSINVGLSKARVALHECMDLKLVNEEL